MLKISFPGCLSLSPLISTQFTLEMCVAASNRRKNSLKTIFWGSRSFKVIDVGTYGKLVSSACYDQQQVSDYLQPFLARLVDSSRNSTFWRGTQIWCICTEDSLNLGGQALHRWNLRLMPNISYAGCPGLSWTVSAQFNLKVCIAA